MTTETKPYLKPLPNPDPDSAPFWEAAKQHVYKMQRCSDCKTYRYHPRWMCHKCNSTNSEWVTVSGKGRIWSWVVVVQPIMPAFAQDVPYAVAVVQLDEQEDLRVMTNIQECDPHDIYAGMPVEVVFDDVTEDVTLPKFRPIRK